MPRSQGCLRLSARPLRTGPGPLHASSAPGQHERPFPSTRSQTLTISTPNPTPRPPGNGIIDELAPLPGEELVHKPGKGAFYATGLEAYLRGRGVTHLLFAGVTTEVRHSARRCVTGRAWQTCAGRGLSKLLIRPAPPLPLETLTPPHRRRRPQVCVQTTMREANDRGYECLLVADATASYIPAFKDSAIEMIVAQVRLVFYLQGS